MNSSYRSDLRFTPISLVLKDNQITKVSDWMRDKEVITNFPRSFAIEETDNKDWIISALDLDKFSLENLAKSIN